MSSPEPRKPVKRAQSKLDLSPRERSILHLATLGYTDRAISAELGISKGTLGTYWNRLRMKVGSFNRTELVATVLRNDFDKELNQVKGEPHWDASQERPLFEEPPGTHANVLLVDSGGTVTAASPTAANLFGLSLQGILGSHVDRMIPDLLDAMRTEILRAQLKPGRLDDEGQNITLRAVRENGIELRLAVILWPLVTNSGWLVLCGLRDLDQEKPQGYPHGYSPSA